jgi:16S rRNA (cytosine1402-N4)-methyltransferase
VEFQHVSVMPNEVMNYWVSDPQGLYLDATLGGAGHSRRLLEAFSAVRLVGIDQDPQALAAAAQVLAPYQHRVRLVRGNFREVARLLPDEKFHGALFDLGVSSPQFDRPERGFSYHHAEAPLDMRMDPDSPVTAMDLINTRSASEIKNALWQYGEERWAGRIADFIVAARRRQPIRTSGELVEIIKAAIPAGARREGGHPARRTFQALRIWVNDELGALVEGIKGAWSLLVPGGRLVVISFHSLEDRLVKHQFRQWHHEQVGQVLTKHPVTATPEEVEANPRARSAKLRAITKT